LLVRCPSGRDRGRVYRPPPVIHQIGMLTRVLGRRSMPRSATHRHIRAARPSGSCAARRWTARPGVGPGQPAKRRSLAPRHRAWR